jgi:antitoxin ParD1/3/4
MSCKHLVKRKNSSVYHYRIIAPTDLKSVLIQLNFLSDLRCIGEVTIQVKTFDNFISSNASYIILNIGICSKKTNTKHIMAKNTSITLGDHFDTFITRQIKTGRYHSVSEVIRAGLRVLENNETKLDTLRNLIKEGENSGTADYSYEKLIKSLDQEFH